MVLGNWTSHMLEAMLASSPYGESMRLILSSDVRVLSFTAGLAFLTTISFGLAPAWRASRTDVVSALKGETPVSGRFRLRRISLTVQVCVSMVLLLFARPLIAANLVRGKVTCAPRAWLSAIASAARAWSTGAW